MVGKILKTQNHLKLIGNPKGMRFESGEVLHMNERICENLKDESHVWVVLKGLFSYLKTNKNILIILKRIWKLWESNL